MNTRLCSPRARRVRTASTALFARPCSTSSARRSTRANRRQPRARHRALGKREQLVAPGTRVLPGFQRGRRGAEDHRAAGELGALDRRIAPGVAQAFLLLERGIVLLVHHHQAQARHRRQHREPRAEHDARVAARGVQPGVGARRVFQRAVQHRDARSGKRLAEARLQLRRQADFGHQHQRLAARARRPRRSAAGRPRSCRCR